MLEKCIKDYVASVDVSVARQPPNQSKLTKMKSIILVALALVAVAVAAPAEYEPAKILESAYEQQPDGSYAYNYKTEDGVSKDETGELRDALDEDNKPHKVVVVRGTYSYPGEDGKPVFVNYYADETGFHAEGETIPKPARR